MLKLLYYKNGFKTFILTIADICYHDLMTSVNMTQWGKGIEGIEFVLAA